MCVVKADVDIAEAGGGSAVILGSSEVDCTHILSRHQDEASHRWRLKSQKTLVSPLWLWDSYEADEQLGLQDPVGTSCHIYAMVSDIIISPQTKLRPAAWSCLTAYGVRSPVMSDDSPNSICFALDADVPTLPCQGYPRCLR